MFYFIFYYTNVYFRFTRVETAMAAAAVAGARDATRLESLVCFYFILFISLMFFFRSTKCFETAMAAAAEARDTAG